VHVTVHSSARGTSYSRVAMLHSNGEPPSTLGLGQAFSRCSRVGSVGVRAGLHSPGSLFRADRHVLIPVCAFFISSVAALVRAASATSLPRMENGRQAGG